jgi:glutamate N-acetyltransferase/amino-acid N-acetyltransferase
VAVGVTFPRGFRAAGATGGIKASGRPDVALVVADGAATAAGVFTRSRAAGAPVLLCRERLAAGGSARAVVVSSGNANVATGAQGRADAVRMAALVGELTGAGDGVLVCSTGVIGVPLPMDRVEAGIRAAAGALAPDGGQEAAVAICTTDSHPKLATRTFTVDGHEVRVGGIAKGAGMIRPDLGTMIAVVTTDAAVSADRLQPLLRDAAADSFNRITVDGCQSTSDSVIVLASGASGVEVQEGPAGAAFAAALRDVCLDLALEIVSDGEGARRIARYEVTGARSYEDADRAARHVAEDQLVRCALYGADPNWGRIVAALGVCGVDLDTDRVSIDLGGVPLVRDGIAVPGAAEAAGVAAQARRVDVRIDLGAGASSAVIYGSDLSTEYVVNNSEYTT